MAPEPRDIMELLMPMFSGTKDDYEKDTVPPLPLSFDRVMEGRLPTSTALLFQLPSEILPLILRYLDPSALANLALVNSDCRQLARSRQFTSIQLDYSNACFGLIQLLLNEGKERMSLAANFLTSLPSLGACIRRITVATHPGWLSSRHDIENSEGFYALDEKVKAERLAIASQTYHVFYLTAIGFLLSNRSVLPHLELLDWEDRVSLPKVFYNHLARSNIKHLKLYRVPVDEEFEIDSPNALGIGGWPLRTLHLEVQWNIFRGPQTPEGSISPLCASILRKCAPTLEALTWTSLPTRRPDPQSFGADISNIPRFPNLRKLILMHQGIDFADAATLNSLLDAPLSVLVAATERRGEYATIKEKCFQDRGRIHSLETFVWNFAHLQDEHSLDFLSANDQLSKLSLPLAVSATLLEEKLLPMLSLSFLSLRSLDLTWEETSIPDSSLKLISTLRSLEQIQLSAGFQYGWRHNWFIDHESLRKHLSLLSRLQKISFRRDTYKSPFGDSFSESYYSIQPLSLEDMENAMDDEFEHSDLGTLFELKHRGLMLEEANKYAAVLPRLEWIYFGQTPMAFENLEGALGIKQAVPLFHERDDCYTLLNRMFAWETS